ncbi:MAG: TetR family transcriptional regulator [Pseudomonadota bacterium]
MTTKADATPQSGAQSGAQAAPPSVPSSVRPGATEVAPDAQAGAPRASTPASTHASTPDAAAAIKRAMALEEPEADGRRARSVASRSRIIEAMVELIAQGNPNPSAADVAQRAGIALRSVYRLFEDKESILREIDHWLVRAYQSALTRPFESEDWQGRLYELIERRASVSEAIVVFRVSSLAARYTSDFVRENYRRSLAREKRELNAILPDHLQTDTRAGRALLIATNFDTWRFLRQDEELSPEGAVAAIKELVDDVIARASAQ